MKNLNWWQWTMLALTLVFALSLTQGCGASFFSCSTEASYNKDGEWSYKSCKNQENFHAKIGKDSQGNPTAEVETTATTAESAIAAAANSLAAMADALTKLIPIIEKAAAMGAGS